MKSPVFILLFCLFHLSAFSQPEKVRKKYVRVQKKMCLECEPQKYGFDYFYLKVRTGYPKVDSAIWMAQMPDGFEPNWFKSSFRSKRQLRKYTDSCNTGFFSSLIITNALTLGQLLQFTADEEWTGAYSSLNQSNYIFDLRTGKRLDVSDLFEPGLSSIILDSINTISERHYKENRDLFLKFMGDSAFYFYDSASMTYYYDTGYEKSEFYSMNCLDSLQPYSISITPEYGLRYSAWNSCCPAWRHLHADYTFTMPKETIFRFIKPAYKTCWNNNKFMTIK